MFIPDIKPENIDIINNANGTYTVALDDGIDKFELHLWGNPVVCVMDDSITVTLRRDSGRSLPALSKKVGECTQNPRQAPRNGA